MSKIIPKVAHLTSAHNRFDTRIFLKQCCSLARNGYSVSLIVSDGQGDELSNNIAIYDVGSAKNRFLRIIFAPIRILKKAKRLDADIYHLHDPELIPIGLILKTMGKVVFFDSHEDVPRQILSKAYLNSLSKWFLSRFFRIFERFTCKRFDSVIAATPAIQHKFQVLGIRSVEIKNYPLLGELSSVDSKSPLNLQSRQVVYVGGLEKLRGLQELVKAMPKTKYETRLAIAGAFSDNGFAEELQCERGWQRTDFKGWLDRAGIKNLMEESFAGLVTLHPTASYTDSLPVKMFEYMAAGLPVIASNFPYWRTFIETDRCGICVDPLDPNSIAEAIDFLLDHPAEAKLMGLNGKVAILNKYNWSIEEKELLNLYATVIR